LRLGYVCLVNLHETRTDFDDADLLRRLRRWRRCAVFATAERQKKNIEHKQTPHSGRKQTPHSGRKQTPLSGPGPHRACDRSGHRSQSARGPERNRPMRAHPAPQSIARWYSPPIPLTSARLACRASIRRRLIPKREGRAPPPHCGGIKLATCHVTQGDPRATHCSSHARGHSYECHVLVGLVSSLHRRSQARQAAENAVRHAALT